MAQPTHGISEKQISQSLLDLIESGKPTDYATIVYFNSTNPTTATIFDNVNPPVTNDPLLEGNVANLYIGTDNSTWVYNGTNYSTKVDALIDKSQFGVVQMSELDTYEFVYPNSNASTLIIVNGNLTEGLAQYVDLTLPIANGYHFVGKEYTIFNNQSAGVIALDSQAQSNPNLFQMVLAQGSYQMPVGGSITFRSTSDNKFIEVSRSWGITNEDGTLYIDSSGVISANISLFEEQFSSVSITTQFEPTQVVGIYNSTGVKLKPSEYTITLPNTYTLNTYVSGENQIIYYHKIQ